MIDAATGDSPRYFQLPQAVRLPPVVDTVHGLIFLVADASNLIVLDGRLPSPRPWVHGARPLPEGEGRKTSSPTAGLPEAREKTITHGRPPRGRGEWMLPTGLARGT